MELIYTNSNSVELLNNIDSLPTFEGELKGSKAFNELMDYALLILNEDFLYLKKKILRTLIRRPRNFEDLLKLGDRAIRNCLYNLEQEGFLARRIEDEKIFYKFDREKAIFKIRKDMEDYYVKLEKMRKLYSKNTLFECDTCKSLYDYPESMEMGFKCCGKKLNPYNPGKIIQNIIKNIAYVEEKLNYFEKIEI